MCNSLVLSPISACTGSYLNKNCTNGKTSSYGWQSLQFLTNDSTFLIFTTLHFNISFSRIWNRLEAYKLCYRITFYFSCGLSSHTDSTEYCFWCYDASPSSFQCDFSLILKMLIYLQAIKLQILQGTHRTNSFDSKHIMQ